MDSKGLADATATIVERQAYSEERVRKQIEIQADIKAKEEIAQFVKDAFDQRSKELYEVLHTYWENRPELPKEKEARKNAEKREKVREKELAKTTGLLDDIATTDIRWLRNNFQLLNAVHDSIKALFREPPQLQYAKEKRKQVHRRLHPRFGQQVAAFRRNLRASPILAVVSGLVIAALVLIVVSPVLLWVLWKYGGSDYSLGALAVILTDPFALVLVGTVGALGSVVSIMLRIRDTEFTYTQTTDPLPYFFFALFKPIVGAAFALFIYAAIRSGLLPLDTSSGTAAWLYIALAFVAGFSERFVRDFLDSTESQLGAGVDKGAAQATPQSTQGSSTLVSELEKLASLRTSGVLSEDQFQQAKNGLLDNSRGFGE